MTIAGDAAKSDLTMIHQQSEPLEDARRGPFRDYSRVLHVVRDGESESWITAFKSGTGSASHASRAVVPALPDNSQQAYCVYSIAPGHLLLGLRNLMFPFAECRLGNGGVEGFQPIRANWGTERYVRSTFAGGGRRIWCIARPHAHHESLAVGAEDGYLRIGHVTSGEFAATGRAEYLGSAVRALIPWRDQRGRSLLIAGTQQADLFCFEVRPQDDGAGPGLFLKFRDLLASPIMSLFVVDIEANNPQLCVLEQSGRITTYDLQSNPKTGGFLSRRTGQYLASDGATTMMAAGPGRLLIAGWNIEQQEGWLRFIAFRGQQNLVFRSREPLRGLEEAANAVESLTMPELAKDHETRRGAEPRTRLAEAHERTV